MMLKRAAVSLVIVLAVNAPVSAGSFSILGFGWDQNDAGSTPGGGVRMTSGNGGWVVDLTLSYASQDYSVDIAEGFRYRGKFKVLPVDLGARYTSPYPHLFRPYAGGGVSYYFVNITTGSANNEWGWYGVGGLYIGNIRTVDFFVEAAYRGIGTSKITFRVLDRAFPARIDLSGWQATVGVTFHF